MDKDSILNMVDNHVALITFTKSDGTERKLTGTRLNKLIPIEKRPHSVTKIGESVPVFDLDLNEWRSFKVNSVKSIRVIN